MKWHPLTFTVACSATLLLSGTLSCASQQTNQQTASPHFETNPEIRRLSPLDENSYHDPAISPDGNLIAYIMHPNLYHTSRQVWVRSVAGGTPKQLTHISGFATRPMFTPDGRHIVYLANSSDNVQPSIFGTIPKRTASKPVMPDSGDIGAALEMVPISGGPATTLHKSVYQAEVSPDGKWIAFLRVALKQVFSFNWMVYVMPFPTGSPRPLPVVATHVPPADLPKYLWAPDSRHLLVSGRMHGQNPESSPRDWFLVPINGGPAKSAGARDLLAPLGNITTLIALRNGKILCATFKPGTHAFFYVDWDAARTRLTGPIRKSSTGYPFITSISSSGYAPITTDSHYDFHFIPMDMVTGEATGPPRRVNDQWHGEFQSFDSPLSSAVLYSSKQGGAASVLLDIATGKEVLLSKSAAGDSVPSLHLSPDGTLLAENHRQQTGNVIWLRSTNDIGNSRLLCSNCGRALGFAPDPKLLLVEDANNVYTLDTQTASKQLWFHHPGRTLSPIGVFGANSDWIAVQLSEPGRVQNYLLPWDSKAPPHPSEWIPLPPGTHFSRGSDLLFRIAGDFLTTQRLNRITRSFDLQRQVAAWPYRELTPFPRPADLVHRLSADSLVVFGPRGALVATLAPRSVWGFSLPD